MLRSHAEGEDPVHGAGGGIFNAQDGFDMESMIFQGDDLRCCFCCKVFAVLLEAGKLFIKPHTVGISGKALVVAAEGGLRTWHLHDPRTGIHQRLQDLVPPCQLGAIILHLKYRTHQTAGDEYYVISLRVHYMHSDYTGGSPRYREDLSDEFGATSLHYNMHGHHKPRFGRCCR